MKLCRELGLTACAGARIVEDEAVHGLSSVARVPTKLSDIGRWRF